MKSGTNIPLADANGQPLGQRIQKVLCDLIPRLRRSFPSLRDDAVVTNILEEAGQRISTREERIGSVDELHKYTWTAVKNAAISKLRRSEHRVQLSSVGSLEAEKVLAQIQSSESDAESIEQSVMLSQAFSRLSLRERQIAIWKLAGFTFSEIARYLNVSPGSVEQMDFRARHRLRKFLSGDRHPE